MSSPPRNQCPRQDTAGADGALLDLSTRLWRWLTEDALPLWWGKGADHANGGFYEALGLDGAPIAAPRRGRVPPRQIYAFSLAARMGWDGPADAAVAHGIGYFLDRFRRPDGLYRTCVEADGRVRDDHAVLYDQAFALLGLYGAHDLEARPAFRDAAEALLARILQHYRHAGGGFREDDSAPFQSNAQMHTFEACIAWSGVGGGPFAETADELGALCLERLIDANLGVVDEYYDAAWRPDGPGGDRRIEPGHQFEWAWLLAQWARPRGLDVRAQVAELFQIGEASVDRRLSVAPAAIDADGAVTNALARLWPQTERLRTAVLLAQHAGPDRLAFQQAALDAGAGILAYLDTPIAGLWRDKLRPDGTFVDEPAPASSLYHLAGAICALKAMVMDAVTSPA